MKDEEKLGLLREKADLLREESVKKLLNILKDRVIELSGSGIHELELKGMLKLIKWTYEFETEYINFLNNKKSEK